MCAAFEAAGANVTLGVPTPEPGSAPVPSADEIYGLPSPLKISRIPVLRLPAREFLFALTALLKNGSNTDVVYSRSITACMAAVRLGFSAAIELHLPASAYRPILIGRLRRLLSSPRLKAVVVISEKLRDDYVRNFPDVAGKIVVAHDGADPANEDGRIEPQKLEGAFKVGYIGHLYPGKGMEIIAPLAQLCPWVSFHIVGGAEPDLNLWKARLASSSNVMFHGYVPHQKTKSYLAGMDVVLAPYLRVVRGVGGGEANLADWMSPLKIFEYMAVGKPILSSDLPVLREVLRDWENALLRDPDDVEAWASALTSLRVDEDLRRRIGEQARQDFSAHYSWDRRARIILDAISARS